MTARGLACVLSYVMVLVAVPAAVVADPKPVAADKTLSPYFEVEGGDARIEAMPLEATRADVRITGVISDVVVKQTYRNDGAKTISARYVFPASTRAAVYGMKMTIGARVIEAKIKEREAARREYDEAKAAGKTASLLEEDRPNVFSMRVANILPKDRIEVELRYTELLVPTDGVYELVYPTVVGPRYASAQVDASAARNQFVATPYQRAGQAPTYTFGLGVELAAGMTIQTLDSPSHAIQTQWGANRAGATVGLDASETAGGNRDFVLRYRLAGADLASGLLLHQGKDPAKNENFFLMMVQPPHRPAAELIPAREYVFILDVSGSMIGYPLDVTKRLMRDLLGRMRPVDRFNVELFSGATSLFAEQSVEASPAQIDKAIKFIDAQHGGGGTELLPALQTAMKLPRPAEGVSRSFVVVTDGYIAEDTAVFDEIRNHLGEANVFAFGIGTSVNRHFIEGIAKAGQGELFVVLDPQEATVAAAKFRSYIQSPVLTNVKIAFEGFAAYDVEPAVLPDVFADRPVVVFGKWKGPAQGPVQGKITLTGVSGRGRFVSTTDVATVTPDAKQSALSYLWARARISELSDFYAPDANRQAIVDLGLRYNLLTQFTSFIAVHQVVRSDGQSLDVAQPVPLPIGVSEAAVRMEEGPEPALMFLLAAVLLAAASARLMQLRRTRRVRSGA
ncbi:MAG: VWA domain-containing protein [Myxococcales bacterium]|nr:VWA domain-containing protein [Myxococcales bacterium]